MISLLVSDFQRSVWSVPSTSVAIALSPELDSNFSPLWLDVVEKNDGNKQLQEVEQEKLKTTAEEDEIICDETVKTETVVEIIHQEQKTASLTFHPVVLLSKFDVQENEENKQLQKVYQDKFKATAEDDEISFDDTFQMETVVEIVHQKQKPASLTVHPAVLLSEFDVKENEENKQMQEVEQEKLTATTEEDEIICD